MEFRGIFVVDEDAALAIGDGVFGLAAERNRSDHGAVRAVNDSCVFAASIEAKDALRGRVVDDGVGIGVGLCGADSFQGFEIEDGGGVCAAVTGEPAT